ncbi:MAG: hypothetical protein KDB83_09220 [Actinobacteria bacterium]|nr:hypothetical protein [Actinomycetota bacterium]
MPSQGGCKCTPDTPVPLLCPACKDHRRRIRDRINRRKKRALARGQPPRPLGTALLPTDTVIDLTIALEVLTDLLQRTNQSGQPTTDLERQLLYSLKQIADTLSPAIQPAHDELIEQARSPTQYDDYEPATPKFAEPD